VAVGAVGGAGPRRGDEDELLNSGDLLAVVVFFELHELRLDVLDKVFALGALELGE
jgi:hypothetical protein